jgi:phosphinothricin acetyltransferase
MTIRDATLNDLSAIVSIYNAAIPGRMATADLEPISIEARRAWYAEHSSRSRPLWVIEDGGIVTGQDARIVKGWISFQSFYGRPAYRDGGVERLYLSRCTAARLRSPVGCRSDAARARIRHQDVARLHLRAQ